MKHLFNFRKGLSLLIILTISSGAFAQWTSVGNANFSAAEAFYAKFAFNSSGVPYVVYSDISVGGKATVMKLNAAGTSWEVVGTAGFTPGIAGNPSIAIHNNVPYIVFSDYYYSAYCTVMKYNGTTWEILGNPGFTPSSATAHMITFDNNGVPYVSCYSDDVDYDIYNGIVMKYNGTAWIKVGASGYFFNGYVDDSKLAFDSNNVPYVAYRSCDLNNGSNKISVRKFDGSTWVDVGGSTPSMTGYLGFTVYNNTPYVSFSDGNQTATTVKLNTAGTAWETVISATFGQTANYTADYMDFEYNNGVPYFVYSDDAYLNLSVVKYNGTAWEKVGASGFSAGGATLCILNFYNNVPYVAYENTGDGKLNVMKFVSGVTTGINSNNAEPTVKAYPNPTTGRFSITMDNTISTSCDIQMYNMVGEVILKKTEVTDKNIEFDLTNYPKGVYLLQIKADKQIFSQKIVRQ